MADAGNVIEMQPERERFQRIVVFSRIVSAPWVNMKRTSAAAIKAFFISLAIAAWISGFVVAYAQSGDLANCARIREVSGGCGKNSGLTEVYVDNMHKDRSVRATVRKHSQEGDEDTDYAIAEGGQLFVGCKVLKREAEKSDECAVCELHPVMMLRIQ